MDAVNNNLQNGILHFLKFFFRLIVIVPTKKAIFCITLRDLMSLKGTKNDFYRKIYFTKMGRFRNPNLKNEANLVLKMGLTILCELFPIH